MQAKKKLLAICGSTRKVSSNLSLIYAIQELYKDQFETIVYKEIDQIPHFNPDLDQEDATPEAVLYFRSLLKGADAVLICTPEYAMGVPGTLKNTLDWTVSSCEFSHKPTALITASSQGFKAHPALLETLYVIECNIPEPNQLIIPFIKTKIDHTTHTIKDQETLNSIAKVMENIYQMCSWKES